MESEVLVSVRVVSYNAEDTIIETLESIKNQTYQNIELVVSDDCSKDNTVSIAREWIESNKERFIRTKLLTVERNTGVCANMNRAWNACHGKWIKGIAADDILLPNCIEDFMTYVAEHPEAHFIASLQRVYNETFQKDNYIYTLGHVSSTLLNLDAANQLKHIAFLVPIMAPTIIVSRKLLETIGGYDERYAYEDHPLYVTMLEHGYKIYFLDKETVGYRIHNSTVHTSGKLFNPHFVNHVKIFRRERCFKYYTWRQKLAIRLIWGLYSLIEKMKMNRNTKINSFIYKKAKAFCLHFGKVK